jgi:single-strand DNA-binding protein
MSENINKVQLVGRLGNAPEIRTFESGKKMARFSVATTESYTDAKGVNVVNTQWHNLVAWGRAAALAEKQLTRGCEVSIEGKLAHRNYIDKAGTKKYVTEIVVAEILLLNSKASKEESTPFLETVQEGPTAKV